MNNFITADEFCNSVKDGTHNSPKKTEYGTKLVTSKNIIGGKLDLSSAYFISNEDAFEVNRRSKVDINDVLISMIGTVGEVCLIENEPNFVIKNVGLFKLDEPMKSKWLYFYLKSPMAQNFIKERLRGTTQQYLPLGELRKFPILLPKNAEHLISVVDILSNLENKINLNHQINHTLEQNAQAIFKSWFVDFDPVRAKADILANGGSETDAILSAMSVISGKSADELAIMQQNDINRYDELWQLAESFPNGFDGDVPSEWEVKKVGEVLETVGGATPSTKNNEFWENGDIAWTTPKDLSSLTDKILLNTDRKITQSGLKKISSGLLPINTVLLSSRAPVGYLALTKIPVAINQGYIAIKNSSNLNCYYTLQWCMANMAEIKGRAVGTTFAEISKSTFREIPIVIPNQNILDIFKNQLEIIYNQITENAKESLLLQKIRDELLPKLLSGEIELSDV